MIGTGGDDLVGVGTERQRLLPAVAAPVQFHRDEGRVLDLDAAAFGGGLQPPVAVGVAPQHRGEQTDQFLPLDRRAAIQPGAVAANEERQIAAFDRHAAAARGMTGPETVRPPVEAAHGPSSRGLCRRDIGFRSPTIRARSEIGTGEVASVTLRLQFHPVVPLPRYREIPPGRKWLIGAPRHLTKGQRNVGSYGRFATELGGILIQWFHLPHCYR